METSCNFPKCAYLHDLLRLEHVLQLSLKEKLSVPARPHEEDVSVAILDLHEPQHLTVDPLGVNGDGIALPHDGGHDACALGLRGDDANARHQVGGGRGGKSGILS